jgi:hypothetical protein
VFEQSQDIQSSGGSRQTEIIHHRKNGVQEIVDVSVVETQADKSLEAWQGAGDAE